MTLTDARRSALAADRAVVGNLVACLVLLVQFLLGMVVNLFVTIPDRHPGANASDYFAGVVAAIVWVVPHQAPWLAAHAVLGLILVVAGLGNLVSVRRIHRRSYTVAAVIGGLALVGAAFNGASFVNYGHDVGSMIMAGQWATAMACYLACLSIAARQRPITASPATESHRSEPGRSSAGASIPSSNAPLIPGDRRGRGRRRR